VTLESALELGTGGWAVAGDEASIGRGGIVSRKQVREDGVWY